MTGTKLAPAEYAEQLRRLDDDELHAEGFRVARAMREATEDGRDALRLRRKMLLLHVELGVRDRRDAVHGVMHRVSSG